jgi:LytS/YehU family sensor histidine kinase
MGTVTHGQSTIATATNISSPLSEGALDSTFGVYTSKEETHLANASPQKPVTTVSVVPSRGALQATVSSQK